MLLFTVR